MQNLKPVLTALIFSISFFAKAQPSVAVQEYINTYKDIAMAEMQRTGVPAAIKLAQGIIETDAGQSNLVNRSNNHFGIKCKSNWTGESVSHDDDARGECFRKYNDAVESYRDHSNFLKTNQRYAALFSLDPTDFEGWANGLKKAGYATNPKYPLLLIKVINENNLQDYSLIAMGKKSPPSEAIEWATISLSPDFAKENKPEKQIETVVIKTEAVVPQKTFPSGEFNINDTKVIYAQKGTSFLALALNHNIPLNKLFEYNDLQEQEIVSENQLIFLQRKRKTGERDYHYVARGETLHQVSQQEGIRLQSILEFNSLNENQFPAAGEKLYLKTKAPGMPKLASAEDLKQEVKKTETSAVQKPAIAEKQAVAFNYEKSNPVSGDIVIHIVQPSETLYHVSKLYEVGVREIYDWNKLSSYDLKEGQQLKILKKGNNVSNSKTSR